MKRVSIMFLLLLSLLLCTSCEKENKLKDGTYTGEGDEWEYGDEDAIVTIKDGKITNIQLRRLDKEGNDVTDEFTGQEEEGKVWPDLQQYSQDMANEMIDEQTYDVDTIAGATTSTQNWKIAAKRALEQAGFEE